MHVSEIFSVNDLEYHIGAGLVSARPHPTLPLIILNYTDRASYAKTWNEVTLNCRGLIVDQDYNVIARPWKKFFNLGEGRAEIDWDSPVEVTDKMDGSLGILYYHQDGHTISAGIATRGSFESDQAKHATQLWFEKYEGHFDRDILREYTFLFEIVYPANRIVLSYGDLDDLVLLGAVHNKYGWYIGPFEADCMIGWSDHGGLSAETFEYRTLQEAFSNNDRPNREGYVVRSGNKMVKLKQVDYIELHRLVTGLNDRTIWEAVASGRSVAEICEPLPDELHDYVRRTVIRLGNEYNELFEEVAEEFMETRRVTNFSDDRKDFAMVASKSKFSGYLFKILDGQNISRDIWQEIRPAATIDGVAK